MEEFCIIRIQRAVDGVKIYCKSEKLERFFKQVAEIQGKANCREVDLSWLNWCGIEGYVINDIPFISFNDVHFTRWGDDLLIDGKPNLSFLRAIGLAEGVEFTVKKVYSLDELQTWTEKAEAVLQKMYLQLFKPIKVLVEEVKDEKKS